MPVTCKVFDNPREEAVCVAAALKKRLEKGEKLENTAILLRTNQEAEGLITCSDGVSDSFYDEGTASESVQTLDLPESVGISAYGSRGQKQEKFSGADESPQSLYFQGCVKEFPD